MRVDANGVSVRAGRLKILQDVTLGVLSGEFVGILGPSGCGKSTLLRALSGQQKLAGGKVLLGGKALDPRDTGAIGFVPQDDIVHTSLTVEKALLYSARLRLADDAIGPAVEEVVRQLDLGERRKTRIERLSGGQRKRVSIGVELLTRPKVLLLDEPTAGLDPALEEQFMDLCRTLARQGRTVLMTTHVMQSLDRLDLVIVMCAGRLVYFGPPAQTAAFFGVGHLNDIYRQLTSAAAEQLATRYAASPLAQTYVQGRQLPAQKP